MGHLSARVKSTAAALLLIAAATAPMHQAHAATAPIRIAFSTWTGYGGLVVGVKAGVFKKYGLDVSYTLIEDPTSRRDALRGGRLDGAATTVDTISRWAGQNVPMVQVLG